jgi:hypothetical protein
MRRRGRAVPAWAWTAPDRRVRARASASAGVKTRLCFGGALHVGIKLTHNP